MTERRISLLARIGGIAAGAAIAAGTIVGLSGSALALTGAPAAALSMRLESAPAAVTCRPGPNKFDRAQLCFKVSVVIVVLENRTPVGTATFGVTHYLHLAPKGRTYTEQVTIGHVTLVGNAGGIKIALGDSCGATCSPIGNNFPVGKTLASGLHGTLTFRDSVAAGHQATLRNKYTWLALKAGATPASDTYSTPIFYRCDDMIKNFPAGCVFPGAKPVLTSMSSLPHIAANIRRIQSRGGHYGRIGSGHPLHRITDKAQQRRNHDFLCPASRPRPAGKQCDEYPFASTREGGNALPASSRGWAWVPTAEQRSQGGKINAFYNANRVLNGDAFWVLV